MRRYRGGDVEMGRAGGLWDDPGAYSEFYGYEFLVLRVR